MNAQNQTEAETLSRLARRQFADDGLDRYRLLVSAMVGRAALVEPAAANEPTYSDGRCIYLSDQLEPPADLDTLAVQSSLIAAGSLELDVMRQLIGRPGVARRYLTVEGWRALSVRAPNLPPVPVLIQALDVERMTSSPQDSLAVAKSRQFVPDPPPSFGVLRPHRIVATDPVEEPNASAMRESRHRSKEDPLEDLNEDEDAEESMILKLFSSPLQSPLAAKLLKKFGAGRQRGGVASGAEMPTVGTRTTTRPGSKAEHSMLPIGLQPVEVATGGACGWRYPEWDAHRRQYRQQWCTVREVEPRVEQQGLYHPSPSTDLRRRLAHLGMELERRRRQSQGDDLDLDAAVESRVSFLAGCTPEDGLYVESQRRRRSLAVLVLLDVSGSLGEKPPDRGTAHEQQRAAAALLLDTLHVLGDRVALYAFRSYGRSSVYLIRVKTFDEVVNAAAYQRLAGLAPGGYTRLGAAIRHSANILTTRAGTKRRLLVVLSDGFPFDDRYEGRYAEADAREALAETRRQGVGCLCLTLGASTGQEGLERVFGTAAHASAARLEDLNGRIGRLFSTAIASADLQRRLAQRHRQGAA